MNGIEQYLNTEMDDGRQVGAFKAGCETNRMGLPLAEAEALIATKAIHTDGLDSSTAIRKIREAYQQYPEQHGIGRNTFKGKVAESIDARTLQLDLTPIPLPAPLGERHEQLRTFIQAAFRPGDSIRIDKQPELDTETQRYNPKKGIAYQYEQVIDGLSGERAATFFERNETDPHGAFIMVNPTNGLPEGTTKEDIVDHRHVLVEFDKERLEIQMAVLVALNLPISTLVYSGGKSLHGLVKIQAGRDYVLFEKRVAFLYKVLHMARIRVDTACKNANRWSRLPGFRRKEHPSTDTIQTLLAVNMGAASWEAWEAEMIETLNDIAPPISFTEMENPPELPLELISGVLRKGQRMLVSAPPKKGKSMNLIQLAVALSTGGSWLNFNCRKSTVLYCNMEISSQECCRRVFDVGQAMGVSHEHFPMVQNLNQAEATLDSVAKAVIHRVKQHGIEVVIVDPIYALLGDEISSVEGKTLARAINTIVAATGAAVIYCHHNNKGAAASNASTHSDRVSGTNVFIRSPDAIMTFTLDARNDGTAFFTLRGFENPGPLRLHFQYPVFRVIPAAAESTNTTADAPASAPSRTRRQKVSTTDFRSYMVENPGSSIQDIMLHFDISQSKAYELKGDCESTVDRIDDSGEPDVMV